MRRQLLATFVAKSGNVDNTVLVDGFSIAQTSVYTSPLSLYLLRVRICKIKYISMKITKMTI